MSVTLPQPPSIARHWTWDDYEPHYRALLEAELNAGNISEWLQRWDDLHDTYSDAGGTIRHEANLDTNDREREQRLKDFMATIFPKMEGARFELGKKLVASDLEPEGMGPTIRHLRGKLDIFREENLPLKTQESALRQQYQRILGSQSVEWEGEEITVTKLRKFYSHADRDIRERAFHADAARTLEDRQALNDLWVEFMTLRKQIYQNAGLNNYREYAWMERARHDYTPEDAIQFCESVEQVVVPALLRVQERRRQQMGLDTLRPWDTFVTVNNDTVDPLGRPALAPFQTADELADKAEAIFKQVDPEMGGFFTTMKNEGLLDLANTRGKAPGAYCMARAVDGKALIFQNATGSAKDINTILHEAGHAFHDFYIADQTNIVWLPTEFAEVASTSMELLGTPYLTRDKVGFFTEADAARHQLENFNTNLFKWCYQAVVVRLQHWVYTHHEEASDPANCDAKWTELWHRYIKGVDYSGFEDWVATGWHRKIHIFMYPFYYIEYGLAQLGAMQVWANALEDWQSALESYRSGLMLGNTVTLPELYAAAGAKLDFSTDTLGRMVDLIEKTINELEAVQA